MEKIKKYKTISILIILIIFTALFGLYIKSLGSLSKQNPQSPSVTPTKAPDAFLHAESLNLPSSYMEYTFTKLASKSATLGKEGVLYSNKSFDLTGTEWLVKKDNVSEEEFQKFKKDFKTFAEFQLFKLSWSEKSQYNKKELKPRVGKSILSDEWGYIKVSDGKYQVLLLKSEKSRATCPCNIQFRVFLSNTEDLGKFK